MAVSHRESMVRRLFCPCDTARYGGLSPVRTHVDDGIVHDRDQALHAVNTRCSLVSGEEAILQSQICP